MFFLYIKVFLALFSRGKKSCDKRQIGKWSDMSVLRIAFLKTESLKQFVRIWSIDVAVFLETLDSSD